MKHIFINSFPRQGWGKCSSFENFFPHNRKQNVSIFMKHICSVSKENIFPRERRVEGRKCTKRGNEMSAVDTFNT